MSRPAVARTSPAVADDWQGRNRLVYTTTHHLISLIVGLRIIRVRVQGTEMFPGTGSVMLMVNHQSNLDPLLVGWATPRPLSMPGKAELFRVPGLRWFITQLGSYSVDREGLDATALRRSLQVLRRGHVLAVFPEGTRSRTGKVGLFNSTLTRLALLEQTAVVPVAIDGSGAVLPPGKRLPRLGAQITICFGQPINPSEEHGRKPAEAALAQATDEIRRRVIELLPPARERPA